MSRIGSFPQNCISGVEIPRWFKTKTMKNEGFQPQIIWLIITPENECCGFPLQYLHHVLQTPSSSLGEFPSSSQGMSIDSLPIVSMGRRVYSPTWTVNFFLVNVAYILVPCILWIFCCIHCLHRFFPEATPRWNSPKAAGLGESNWMKVLCTGISCRKAVRPDRYAIGS